MALINKIVILIFVIILSAIFNSCDILKMNFSKDSRKFFATVKLNDNLNIDATEINVASWLSYYSWKLENEGINEANKVLPDSNALESEVWQYIKHKSKKRNNLLGKYTWKEVGSFCEECGDFISYDKHLNAIHRMCPFLNFPITGVSYEQVKDFCDWRTTILGETVVIYRLPTPEEWIKFSLKGLSEVDKNNGFRDSTLNKYFPSYNYKSKQTYSLDSLPTSKQFGIFRYQPELTKAFDVFGNVSEMTSIKGVAKGGNYLKYAYQCHPDSVQYYKKPEVWLGFRCVSFRQNKK